MTHESSGANLEKLKQWAEDVVCPVCFAPLRFGAATVVCSNCARTYPVVDGIPVLIPQRAR
ncbi:MAG: Trm112 family protein [Terracidiphilus sp.]